MNSTPSFTIHQLQLGMTAEFVKTFTQQDVDDFARVSGDCNPVHLDAEFAAQSRFGRPIAHGMLTASLISACLGQRLPGQGTVYLSQSVRFMAPVYPGEEIKAQVTVMELLESKNRVRLQTQCWINDKLVLEGEAWVMAPT
ncbi:MAG: hypothetical protein RLZZ397_247 [Pseudomonadota bacterium]|jgi:3-hydroxybutyryl-CoA dehydratase